MLDAGDADLGRRRRARAGGRILSTDAADPQRGADRERRDAQRRRPDHEITTVDPAAIKLLDKRLIPRIHRTSSIRRRPLCRTIGSQARLLTSLATETGRVPPSEPSRRAPRRAVDSDAAPHFALRPSRPGRPDATDGGGAGNDPPGDWPARCW